MLLEQFLKGEGPKKILIYHQVQDQISNDEIKEANADPMLFITQGDTERIKEKAIYFIRNLPENKKTINLTETNDNEILFGEISSNVLMQLNNMMELVYFPMIERLEPRDWEKCEEESRLEFVGLSKKFSQEVFESIKSIQPGQEIFHLDQEEYNKFNQGTGNEQEKQQYLEKKFSSWITTISTMLNDDNDAKKEPADAGPRVELEYWKSRMQKITSLSEQLRSNDFKFVKGQLFRHKPHNEISQRGRGDENISKLMMDYSRVDLLLTDKLNEAKDNVKYLTTLEKFIEPLYTGTPQQIIDTLPALMNAIKMIHTIARFYYTADKMTGLFMKITNQMITNCKKRILNGKTSDDIWKRDPAELIEVLGSCIKLNREYKECYKDTKDKVADMPKGKTFDFSETQIFGKFDLFCRRVVKLIDIFNTIQQFQSLANHNLEGMEKLTAKFKERIEDFKKNRYDLLNYQNNQFDLHFVEFNLKISDLDAELQNFIDNNFNRFRNIEYSLKLLHKFENTLKRDSLKHNLTSKYNSILHNYAVELDHIQRVFTDQKGNPPIVRNMPPEAGKIIWSRHLFQKITGPINMFPENVMNSPDIRKYYGSYNTLGKQLTVYEMWYYKDWCGDIEKSKAALQATLIIRYDETKKLYVNFDPEIMQLIREAKCMDRVGIEIPESARIILLQEEKFKMYYNELLYVLKEHDRIISKIKPINKNLLNPHQEDLELKLLPGRVTLTWTSMNIDSYLQHVHQGLNKLEQLIINVNDIIENRIENNLKNISKVLLVSLPQDSKPFSLEQFVSLQRDYIKSKTEYLMSKNVEVERAVDDLIQTINSYPLDKHLIETVNEEETKRIKKYYFWYLYQALLNSTQNSLNAMKYRVCGSRPGGGQQQQTQQLKPFFEVCVQLEGQKVELNPNLTEIQKSINRAATHVLRCSKTLYNWDQQEKDNDKKASFYEMIAQDKEIVKVILLLTGSIQGTKNKVNEFLASFSKFEWLWKENVNEKLNKFGKKNPSLQDYEDELKKFTYVEDEIDKIEHAHKIGAMELKTDNLCQQLKSKAKEWKLQYAQDLHKRARTMLDQLTEQTKNLDTRLRKEVKDIDSLGYVMETLEEIRKQQAEIEMKFNPVLEMYSLLDNHLPGGITDKDEMDARSMIGGNWSALIHYGEVKQKELQQKQSIYLKDLKRSVKEFIKDVADFRKDYELNGPMVENITPREAIERLRRFEDEYSVKFKFYKINKSGEDLFGLQNQKYPELEKTEGELKMLKKLYSLYAEVIDQLSKWREKSWADVTVDQLKDMEEQVVKYGDLCMRLPRELKEWQAYKELKQEIENLKAILPIIRDLKKPSIKLRHWQKIVEVTGKPLNYEQEDNFYMNDLIEANLLEHQDDIIDITESADKQLKIEIQLEEVKTTWDAACFDFSTWGKQRDYPCILNGMSVQTIQEKLDEDQMLLATLIAQRHVLPFKPIVEAQITIFGDVSETLDMWIKVQVLWTSLEAVFTGGDIARNMPVEAKKFAGIDKNWLKIMEKAVETKKVIQCCQNDMLNDFLPELQKNLEICQKSLEQYLEGKRKKFARFYFVSNPTLLKILSQGSEPTSIQDDFEKLFDAINRVTFDKNPDKKGTNEKIIRAITQMMGKDDETIQLVNYVKCEGNIETWLKVLEHSMQFTMKDIIRQASTACMSMGLKEFLHAYSSQVSLLGIQLIWTAKMTEALEKTGKNEKATMEQKRKDIQVMLETLTQMCLETITSNIERTKIETLVTIHVHQRDLTNDLKVKDVNDFDWQKQTRLYWKQEQDNCVISITDWDAPYNYEFLGAKERLCITPLTDRCYITLAQAMSMYYGGAPAGPAGTGKTETVKDLGRTLGIFVVVTNCSDQHKYRDMAKIFKGLVQSGLWGCFDEFNRITLEVLSVVGMQIEVISAAKKQHLKEFMFPEETANIELVQSVGYFITMNPGYAGRQELPENLKVLFRGVSMMVPDREIIIKVKLASVGYTLIDGLSKKFNMLYRLCEEQLSKQRHYDFGLRNILSVLRTAGNTKRGEQKAEEEMLLMRSLRDMNLSKLVAQDIPLFNNLLIDIFPRQTEVPKKVYADVEAKIPDIIKKRGLISHPPWIMKIIQLYETSLVRHGFMLVGPAGSGKTMIMNVLTDVLTELIQPYKITKLNPKAITPEEMYGVKSEISDDWTPGIFSTLWQKANVRNSKFNTWLTCDGPVDAIWIENLNTVLDDNKILTLANGERIPMTDNCKLVFEVENLNNASPATVSRCGQVYVSATDLGHEPVIKGWILGRKAGSKENEEADRLNSILMKYFITNRLIESLDKICKSPVMDVSLLIKITNTLNLLTGMLKPLNILNKVLSEQDYEKIIIYCITWAVGGVYEMQDRQTMHEYLWSKGAPLPPKSRENETIYDYFIHIDEKSGQIEWKLCSPEEWRPPEKLQFSQLLIPTVDSFRAELLINLILNQEKSLICSKAILLVGGAGTAKTSSVLMYSNKFKQDVMLFKRLNFSSATKPSTFQETIDVECDFKVGKDFAPPGNKQMTLFIDDMSMPQVNKWNDQETLEIVRQLIETSGFYMLDKTQRGNFKTIRKLQYIGAMNHPGGGRNDVPNRLKRLFFIFNMVLPLSVEAIYGPIIEHTFKPKYFTPDFNRVVKGLSQATVKLWNKVKNTMLPTPSKFHYIFNMRELSRIFKGVLQTKKEVILSASSVGNMKPEVFLIGLWRHECERVFVDKLTNSKDKEQVLSYIQEISLENFSQLESEILERFTKEKVFLFCDFLREDTKNEEGLVVEEADKVYEAIADMEKLRIRCYSLLSDYNLKYSGKKMSLVLFDDAIKHLLRISRIIKMPRSSALLVGVGGSGKQSLTRLAAEIGRNSTYQLVITKNFSEKDLKDDLKNYFDFAGHFGRQVTFIMTDSEVKKEEFLEYVNMILSTGEIPKLIPKDEKEVWLGEVRNDYCKERNLVNYDPSANELYAYFLERLRDNLHIVLCFSPVGQKFRDRARKFPALFNECTIDWFLPWPEEALVSVAESFIKNFKGLETPNEVKIELFKHMGTVHLIVTQVCDLYFQKMRRAVFVTPKSFLSYLNSYKDFYMKKFGELDIQGKSYKIGLEKISEATIAIAKMEIGLKDEESQLKEASDKTDIMLQDLEKESKKVKLKNDEVEAITAACKKNAEMIATERESAEKDLQAALPALKRAEEAVASLDNKDIIEIKTTKTPHEVIKYIFDLVCIYFQVRLSPVICSEEKQFDKKSEKKSIFIKDSWEDSGKSVLVDPNLIKKLKEYDRDSINEETIELLAPYYNLKDDWFSEKNAINASKAASAIYKWGMAIYDYHDKSKIVKPKKENLVIQEGRLAVAQNELRKAQLDLAAIQAQLAQLKENFSKQIEEKMNLENKMNKTKKKINTARTLISSLSGEKERWGKGAAEINEQKRRLVGNVSLACAFISYCGPFNSDFRSLLSNDYFVSDMKKRGIPVTPNLELLSFLVDDATVGEWNLQGLPKDDLSIQNGVMVTNSSRYPLLIDPQGQGQNWIMRKYFENYDPITLQQCRTTLSHPKFKDRFLKFCMENGKTLIVEGIENEVDPILDPVLEKQIQVKGKTKFVDVAGTTIDFSEEFNMFLITRLPNPQFSPELSAKTTIIDFTVTQTGLEQQLLGRVLSKEQKALEESLNQLLADVNFNKRDLQRLDKNLLERLTQSKGNLLDDTELMDVLNSTKTQSKEVQMKLVDAEIKTKEINEKREQYRSVAVRGSALYFCMIEMSLVNWMYNSSLEQFLKLFDFSIDESDKAQLPSKRVEIIIEFLTFHVYNYVNRGLFEADKATFVLIICFKILTTKGTISANDVSMFLKGGDALDAKSEKPKPLKELAEKSWLNVIQLSRHQFANDPLAFFRELPDSITRNEAAWNQWLMKNDPENYPIPDFAERINAEKDMTSFLTLCVVRSLRMDRTLIAATRFINNILSKKFTDPVSYPIDKIWSESNKFEPMLFLLSAGADPTSSIDELAKKKKKFPCTKVSMGEGQDKVASQEIADGFISGSWIILQNCHLGLKFMEDLLTILSPDAQIHEEFRLWITCEPHPKFPLALLQRTIKVTNEPPKGVKAGLFKTFTTIINQDFLEKIEHPSWKSLIFTICFLHSIVQERRKFKGIGWCIPYEFNNSDLEASLCFIEKYLGNLMSGPTSNNQSLPISTTVIKYMVCEVQYGGRITDDLDRELFIAFGDDYLKDHIFQNEHVFFTIETERSGSTVREKFAYKIPANPNSEIAKYREYVDTIPSIDSPDVFGLHPNADRTFRENESFDLINTIKETRPKDSSGGSGQTREEMVSEKSKELLDKLPPDYIEGDVEDYLKKLGGPKNYMEKGRNVPLNIFLFQEIQRMQVIISLVRKTLTDTIDAIDGQIIMTPNILDAINSISDARVPNTWVYDATGAEISWILPGLGSWFRSLVDRNNELSSWLKNQRPNVFWLTGFFNPQGFLTAMKQEVARLHKPKPGEKEKESWSLDDVVYKNVVKEANYDTSRDSEGVFIRGLFLHGGRWNKTVLDEPIGTEMFFDLPLLYWTAETKKKAMDPEKMSQYYHCPLYKYPKRTDKYIISRVLLPCEPLGHHKAKLRGIALLCSKE